MKNVIMFGAGNIGRGFIGMLLGQAGYHVIFADVNETIIERLHNDRSYTVHIMDTEKVDYVIDNVDGILSTGQEAVDEIAKAEIVTTAVGLMILPRIAPAIAKGIALRKENGCQDALNVIACENAIRASSQLKEHIYALLDEDQQSYADQYVGFADCSVDRIVPPVTNEIPTDVVVEAYYEWNVEKASLKGDIPEINGMNLADNLEAYIERKLFTLNTGHCITAYLGNLKGLETIKDSIEDPDIYNIVHTAMEQSGAGLVQKHGFDPETHAQYIEKIIKRFKNPYLHDDVKRVGREPLRKLSPTDRLIKPMSTALQYNLPVDALIQGVGAAFNYVNEEDEQAVEMQEKIANEGFEAACRSITGIEDETIIQRMHEAYLSYK